jgi:hypothetical protein
MNAISFWLPATICAVISLAALLGTLPVNFKYSKYLPPIFYIFLPMCFFIVGSMLYRMHREISRLRHRIGRLEYKREGAPERELVCKTVPGNGQPLTTARK